MLLNLSTSKAFKQLVKSLPAEQLAALSRIASTIDPTNAEHYLNTLEQIAGLAAEYPQHVAVLEQLAKAIPSPASLQRITERIKQLGESTTKLLDDLAKNPTFAIEFFAKAGDNPGLVESWKVLQNTSFSTEIKWLESFDALKKNDLLKYVSEISDAEATAIHRYTIGNEELTRGAYRVNLTPEQQEWIDLVNSGLDKLRPTKGYQGKVFRGSNRPESEIIERYVNVYHEGVVRGITPRVNEPPLLSTSKSNNVAEYFISKGKRPDYAEVMFEMTSKRGVDIDDISDYGKYLGPKNHPDKLIQQEVILSNNQDYEILDVIKSIKNDGTIRYIIKLSE